ncbi:PfkB family carbohydrate kinase [Agromyces italicus]|uniref:PfkB family carbohydrate kinase n=1 Tax=Agromyces italicus TaxID=279572 RepID=UPI0003B49F4B|nr:PfkB family carbohydrate kinase [Agromyces italicus]
MTGRPARVVGFGDNVVDRFTERGVLYPGGNCVNFAVFAGRLGAESAYLGVLGSDDAARHLRASLTALGVSTERCVEREGDTGWCDVTVVDGDRVFGNWDAGVVLEQPFEPSADDYAYLAGFDLVHMSAYAGLEPHLAELRTHARLVSFDLSDEAEQRSAEYLDGVAPWVDLAVLSLADLDWPAAEALAREVHARGAGLCLVTRGLEGSAVFDGERMHRADAVEIDAHDTMGAGDAFITAFTLTLLEHGWSRDTALPALVIETALRRSARFAAEQCAVDGAFGYPKEILQ